MSAIIPLVTKVTYGSRFIAASSRCTTTLVLKILTACLGLVSKRQQVYYEVIYRNSGIKGYWLIPNSDEVSDLVSEANSKGNVTSIKTYDFSTIYTNLPHTELKERIPKLVRESFEGFDKKYISKSPRPLDQYQKTKHAPFNAPGYYENAPFPPRQCVHSGWRSCFPTVYWFPHGH